MKGYRIKNIADLDQFVKQQKSKTVVDIDAGVILGRVNHSSSYSIGPLLRAAVIVVFMSASAFMGARIGQNLVQTTEYVESNVLDLESEQLTAFENYFLDE